MNHYINSVTYNHCSYCSVCFHSANTQNLILSKKKKGIFIKQENPLNILIEKNEITAEKNDDLNKKEEIKNERDPQAAIRTSKEKQN